MNCSPLPLPTFLAPAESKAGPPLEAVAGGASAGGACAGGACAGGAWAGGAAPPPKPQPCFPFWKAAPGPEQMPEGKAQQPLPQSALERHWPVMNCVPLPLPTFLAPAGSKGGPPLAGVVDAGGACAGGACAGGACAGGASGAGAGDAPPPNPQPSFPCWNEAPGPEQIPVGLAQQPLPQSASDRHWPVMNCAPFPLPTFFAPAGSNGGIAATMVAIEKRMAIVKDFIVNISMESKRVVGEVKNKECRREPQALKMK